MARHYEHGAPEGWEAQHVSAYATMHPWEDWAETFAHYLPQHGPGNTVLDATQRSAPGTVRRLLSRYSGITATRGAVRRVAWRESMVGSDPMGSSTVEDSAMEGETIEGGAAEGGLGATVRSLNVFDGLALLIALGLVGVGFLVGTIGSGATGSSSTVDFTVIPEDQVRPLAPGATATLPIYINNPNDYGVRVDSISEGSSKATASGCPAGTITSTRLDGPIGFIRPGSIRTYELSVTRAATTDNRCKDQSFTVPLTVTLASAAADR